MNAANRGPFSLPKKGTAAEFGRTTKNTTCSLLFLETRDKSVTKRKLVNKAELIASFLDLICLTAINYHILNSSKKAHEDSLF
ncbi:MAG: hypothetical protein ACE5OZ_19175 [Candidatus Heimdallarchaeota archaeon]